MKDSVNVQTIATVRVPAERLSDVLGHKGSVLQTLRRETGAHLAVGIADDPAGIAGIVTISGTVDAIEEANRRISLILDPPTAEVGSSYFGSVVNITKFGAFVNILPGRDGLLHISKLSTLAGGKHIDNVGDVLKLGESIEVRVDDIDPQGKVSLSLKDHPSEIASNESRATRSSRSDPAGSFEDAFEAELVSDVGDLDSGGLPEEPIRTRRKRSRSSPR